MVVRQLPLHENFAKIVLKEWFDDSSVLQMIKEETDKGSDDDDEMDGDKESRVLHSEGLVALEIGL